ncbi:hypothetical protein FRC07_005482 [Ceratobasidium sp. 392]|nr:hypothetical protein FRC07_005482 [Ceratobasidium sp. 392]
MEALNKWVAAQSHLTDAATSFLDACITLRKVAAQSFPSHLNQIILENVLSDIQSQADSIRVVENCMHESRAVLNALFNVSTSRAPINKLPSEILGRIFSILVASSPCHPSKDQRDTLLDILLVCARWHQVAMNNQVLWSHIDIASSSWTASSGFNRTQLWLDRSRGASTHIHLSKSYLWTLEDTIPNIISILQPYATLTSSLVISDGSGDLVRALLALYFNNHEPSSLRTLALSNVWMPYHDLTFPWPTYPLQSLAALELCDLQKFAIPALDEIVTMLSNCPRLHTLRLVCIRHLRIRTDQPQSHGVIFLPNLKLLELKSVLGEGLPALLKMLRPGESELDVRLGIGAIGEHPVSFGMQSLLARSNVVSLNVSNIRVESEAQLRTFFSCVPHLRALQISILSSSVDILPILKILTSDNAAVLPGLQSLCFSGKEICLEVMNQIKNLVSGRRLRNLVFLSCEFLASYDEHLPITENQGEVAVEDSDEGAIVNENEEEGENEDDSEDQDDGEDQDEVTHLVLGTPEMYFKEMPQDTKQWLLKRVERAVVCKTPAAQVFNGVDVFVQELIKID